MTGNNHKTSHSLIGKYRYLSSVYLLHYVDKQTLTLCIPNISRNYNSSRYTKVCIHL